jgi:hypothetical protein
MTSVNWKTFARRESIAWLLRTYGSRQGRAGGMAAKMAIMLIVHELASEHERGEFRGAANKPKLLVAPNLRPSRYSKKFLNSRKSPSVLKFSPKWTAYRSATAALSASAKR